MKDIKIEITPSILEQISDALKKEASICYEKSYLENEIMSAIRDTEGKKVIFIWKPSYDKNGKLLNF